MSYAVSCSQCNELYDQKRSVCPNCGYSNEQVGENPIFLFRWNYEKFISSIIGVNIFFFLCSLFISVVYLGGIETSFLILPSPNFNALKILGWSDPTSWQSHIWQLVTAQFLHGGVIHIAFNMLCFRDLGRVSTRFFSVKTAFIVYILSGIGGNIFAMIFGGVPVVGASGSVFGLIGAILAYGMGSRDLYNRFMVSQIAKWAGLMLFFGFLIPGISNSGHIGGVLTGICLGRYFKRTSEGKGRSLFTQVLIGVIALAYAMSLRNVFLLIFP